MYRLPIRRAIGRHVPEEKPIAGVPLAADARERKLGLASLEILIQIEQESQDALPVPYDLLGKSRLRVIEIIMMRREDLTRLVVQHRGSFEEGNRYTDERCDASAHQSKNQVAARKKQLAIAVGAGALVLGVARFRIVSLRRFQSRPRKFDKALADSARGKIFNDGYTGLQRNHLYMRRLKPVGEIDRLEQC